MHSADNPAEEKLEENPVSAAPRKYSKAFENMVTDGDDDIVGLLAYALLKQNIREDAARGVDVSDAFRDPTPVTVKLYRSSAESILTSFAARAIDDARPEIQESAVLSYLQNVQSELASHITQRTGTLPAIFTNIIAWMVTGFLTVVVLLGLAASGLGDRLINNLTDAVLPVSSPQSPPPSDSPSE